jgi:uncharacterized membrane protein
MYQYLGFRWTTSGGMQSIGDLPGGNTGSIAAGISADASVIVGTGTTFTSSENRAFRRTDSGGMEELPLLSGGWWSSAEGVSADGSVIAGCCDSTDYSNQAVRWTSSGIEPLGFLPGGASSKALAVSADGLAIVGESHHPLEGSPYNSEAFLWTQSEGMIALGNLPGGFHSQGYAVSDGGNVVVGHYFNPNIGDYGDNEAFIWDRTYGIRKLQDMLMEQCHLDLTGWTLYEAYGITPDGKTIVGAGINPAGNYEAYIAHIPEPCSLSFLLLGALAFYRKSRITCYS